MPNPARPAGGASHAGSSRPSRGQTPEVWRARRRSSPRAPAANALRRPPRPGADAAPSAAAPSAAAGPARDFGPSASRSGTAASAAADGVAARTSATRSTTVMSTSCPTAEIMGTEHAATARATRSSLKAQRSSRAPPPRPMITHVGAAPAFDTAERAHQFVRGALPLHLRRAPARAAPGEPASGHRDDVLQRRAVGTRDHGHDARQPRQRTLARFVEQAVAREPGQRLLERLAPQTVAFGPDPHHPELQVAASRVHRHLTECRDLHAIRRTGRCTLHVAAPHHAAHPRLGVAQREVPVPVAMGLEIADLAAHPERCECAFDHILRSARERSSRPTHWRAFHPDTPWSASRSNSSPHGPLT